MITFMPIPPALQLSGHSKAHTCKNCGVDLAIAAVLAERRVNLADNFPREKFPEGIPITPEILVPRLGDYLLEKGVLHPDELERALQYQRAKTEAGQPILLGQALRELDLVDSETLDQAVTVQILQLQTALSQSNHKLEQRVEERTGNFAPYTSSPSSASSNLISLPTFPTNCAHR
jgi:hypothetical protein